MTMPRHAQVSLDDTPWYHCVSRCVRQAYLCGSDYTTGKSYEHRRDWVVQRIKHIAAIFTIDVASYAVMSNHYHIVVRVDNERPYEMSTREVLKRWSQLYTGPLIINRYLTDKQSEMSEGELFQVEKLAAVYRDRLCDLSWFMKNINEYIARKANKEDKVKGHFWESRYKCQSLLDEKALLTAMAYVDLNPVRAVMASTPEDSEFTSVHDRIKEIKGQCLEDASCAIEKPLLPDSGQMSSKSTESVAPLMPFDATGTVPWAIPFDLQDYLELLDWSGRIMHPDKRGCIDEQIPPILKRIAINPGLFIQCAGDFMYIFGLAVGSPQAMAACCMRRQVKYLRGMKAAKQMLGAA